jgi:hypothetical protein
MRGRTGALDERQALPWIWAPGARRAAVAADRNPAEEDPPVAATAKSASTPAASTSANSARISGASPSGAPARS